MKSNECFIDRLIRFIFDRKEKLIQTIDLVTMPSNNWLTEIPPDLLIKGFQQCVALTSINSINLSDISEDCFKYCNVEHEAITNTYTKQPKSRISFELTLVPEGA